MKTKIFIAICIALGMLSEHSNAQIFYQDINPDITINTWNAKDIHIDSLATSSLSYGGAGNLTIWQEFNSQIVVNAFSACEVLMFNGYPAALNLNELLSSTPWQKPSYSILNDGTHGNWMGVTDKYLGVRIKNGANYYYGWIRMDVNDTGNSVTIKDYACNRLPNASINAGQMPSGIQENNKTNTMSVSFYPNPFSSSTILNVSVNMKNALLILYNSSGIEVKTISNISGKQLMINRDNLASGLYYYALKQDQNNISTGKLIITDGK